MTDNPYRIEGPAIISFSGGRSSGYMLKHIIDAWSGALPDDVKVCFANTGKEHLLTLDFVRDCEEHWPVKIHWLEWQPGEHGQRWREVDHATASRDGEPYKALIRQKQYLPNPVTRFCTIELKIRVMRDFCRSLGWEHWTNIIGLRADEPRRVSKALAPGRKERWENAAPLARGGITKKDVIEWWGRQNFGLALANVNGSTPLGNCDLCFLKSAKTIQRIMAEQPELARWWIEAEAEAWPGKPSGRRFRIDRPSYAEMLKAVQDQRPFDFGEQDTLTECMCHD